MSSDERNNMAWICLLIAGLLEIVWLFTMKFSENFTKMKWSVVTAVAMIASFALLSFALKTIPTGTAYAIWTGVGAAGAAIVGILIFNESRDVWRLVSIALIVAGIVGLKLSRQG